MDLYQRLAGEETFVINNRLFKKEFQEISQWITSDHQVNSPLVIVKEERESLRDLFSCFIRGYLEKPSKNLQDIFIPIFISYEGVETSPYYVIFKILVKFRQIFNIKRRIDLEKEQIRISFFTWLTMVSDKLQ